MHAEIIFEPGDKSVLSFDSDTELKDFLIEHVRRAKAGEDGGPSGVPASRVSKVVVYDEHPADLWENTTVGADTLKTLIDGMADEGGNVSAHQLIAALRDEISPVYPLDQGKHNSMYKAEGKDLDLSFLEGDVSE